MGKTIGVESAPWKSPLNAGHRSKSSCDRKKRLWAQCREVIFVTPFVVRMNKRYGVPFPLGYSMIIKLTFALAGQLEKVSRRTCSYFISSFIVLEFTQSLVSWIFWFPGFLVPLVPLVSWLNQEFYFNRHERKQFLRRIHLKIYNPSIHLFRIFFCLYSYNLVKLISSNFWTRE